MEKLQRDVRLLKAYALIVTLLLGALAFAGFSQAKQKTKFTEIDVERINIVEDEKGAVSHRLSAETGAGGKKP